MMFYLLFLLSLSKVFSSAPIYWSSALEIKDRHDFYLDNQVIDKPKGTWQLLFSIVYPDRELKLEKDCVFYQVPKNGDGVLKIKTLSPDRNCADALYEKGDQEIGNLKSLQFSTKDKIVIFMTLKDYKSFKWEIPLLNNRSKRESRLLTSSAAYQTSSVLFLSPKKNKTKQEMKTLKNSEACHLIDDECNELAPSTCELCPLGWYEVPNGCSQGPKYCGIHLCGLKNRPACRKGVKFLTQTEKLECRIDSGFVYCAPGLKVFCEGALAYCR